MDIRDPCHPKDVGYYIPAARGNTDKRCVNSAHAERGKGMIQTNNVEVDDRHGTTTYRTSAAPTGAAQRAGLPGRVNASRPMMTASSAMAEMASDQ